MALLRGVNDVAIFDVGAMMLFSCINGVLMMLLRH